MGFILKKLLKSIAALKFLSKKNVVGEEQRLLLQRFHGSPSKYAPPYFSAFSPQDHLQPTKQIHLPQAEDFRVAVGSIQGIVCLDNSSNEFFLWNPSTGESKIITSKMRTLIEYNSHLVHTFASGFGYDSISGHLKLIRFEYEFEPRHPGDENPRYMCAAKRIELYNLNSNSVRLIAHPQPFHFVAGNPSVYVDGYNYWLSYYKHKPYILSFDYAKEDLCAHDLPDVGETLGLEGSLLCEFVDFKGEIGVIVFPKFGADKTFGLWLSHGEKWIKEYEFHVPGAETPLGFWNDGCHLFFQGVDGGLMLYNFNTGKTKKFDEDSSGKMKLIPYVESNVSIRGLLGSSKPPLENSLYKWLQRNSEKMKLLHHDANVSIKKLLGSITLNDPPKRPPPKRPSLGRVSGQPRKRE